MKFVAKLALVGAAIAGALYAREMRRELDQ
jgi:hypothetical protein